MKATGDDGIFTSLLRNFQKVVYHSIFNEFQFAYFPKKMEKCQG